MKINNKKFEMFKCNFLKQNDECIQYEHFSSQMRKSNNETKTIVLDILYISQPLHFFKQGS
jgi:hypothetical protein